MAESRNHIDSVGQQVGDYRLLRLLGGGGFGVVYLAEHVRNHTYVAVKILQARLTRSEELKAFINEARTFRLKHPHIVPLLDFGMSPNDVPYLVMEYAPKGTLRERHPLGTQTPLPLVVSYVNQIASALQYAHNLYLIHRDVKPENLLVGANGEILLTDFGIAAGAHNSYTLNKQQEVIGGTVFYMAPEQIEGKPRAASDQYALGILTYEWLSGRRPFQGTPMEVILQHMTMSPAPLSRQAPMLTANVEHVVFTALAKDPRQRFNSIQAFATALTQASQPQQYFPLSQPSAPHSSLSGPSGETIEQVNTLTPAMRSNDEHVSPTPSFSRGKLSTRSQSLISWGMRILLVIFVLLLAAGTTFAYMNYIAKPNVVPPPPRPAALKSPPPPELGTNPSGFYNWVTSRQPATVQTFEDTTSAWDTSNGCGFVNGNYQINAAPSPGTIILAPCMAKQTNYSNFILQIDMTMTRCETAGIIFRSNPVLNAEYLFEMNSDNTYFINASTLSFSAQTTVIPRASFSRQTTNTVTIIAHDQDLYLFINRHFLIHMSDTTSRSGQIGLFVNASPIDQGGAQANFSNIKVWKL